MKNAISVTGLSKRYGESYAVANATFSVPSGSICGFIGPNGAGKTTTIRAILGLIKPTSGEIEVLGTANPKEFLPRVGAMIEGPAFYPLLSGATNLKVLADLGGFPKIRIIELLRLVGLDEKSNLKFKDYSLGMKQRLGIAAALLPNPELLILDEPTNGLDPNGILEIRNLIKRLAKEGKTIFVSSHLLSELEALCEHLVMIKTGKIIFTGAATTLSGGEENSAIIIAPEYLVDINRLIKLLEEKNYSFKMQKDEIEVGGGVEIAAQLNRLAFEAGITLKQISIRKTSLEDSFFEMVSE
jgi:ABC-2 type transport system ATP-binding protein